MVGTNSFAVRAHSTSADSSHVVSSGEFVRIWKDLLFTKFMSYFVHAFASASSLSDQLSVFYDTKSVLPIHSLPPPRFAFKNENAVQETHDEQNMKCLTENCREVGKGAQMKSANAW